jgi:outer membrane protein
MARFIKIYFSLLLLGLSLPTHAFDLLDAWNAAQQYDAGFAAASADYQAGQEQGVQGLAQLMPQVNLTSNYGHNNPINALQPGSGTPYTGGETHGYGVNLTQPLFDLARYANYRSGGIKQDIALTTYQSVRQKLMGDVAAAYFNVLLAQDTLTATEVAKSAFVSQLAQAKAEFEIGTATIVDSNEAQAGYDGALADEIQAQNDLEINRNAFTRLTGLSALAIQPLAAQIPLEKPQPDSLDAWLDQAQVHSLTIRAKQQALDLARQNLTNKRSGHLPVIQLTAGYQDSNTNDPLSTQSGSGRTRGSNVGVNLTMPLFAGGGINSQVREAVAQQDSASDQLEDARRQTREAVRSAWLGVTNGAAYVRAQQQRLISAKSKLDSTVLGKDVGVRTNLDLLRAQQDYTDVLKNLANARYRYLNAHLQLAQATGVLDVSKLQQLNLLIRH